MYEEHFMTDEEICNYDNVKDLHEIAIHYKSLLTNLMGKQHNIKIKLKKKNKEIDMLKSEIKQFKRKANRKTNYKMSDTARAMILKDKKEIYTTR